MKFSLCRNLILILSIHFEINGRKRKMFLRFATILVRDINLREQLMQNKKRRLSCVAYLHYNGIRNRDSLSSYHSLLMAAGFAVLSPALCVSPSRRTRCASRINISAVSRVVSSGDRRHHDFSC